MEHNYDVHRPTKNPIVYNGKTTELCIVGLQSTVIILARQLTQWFIVCLGIMLNFIFNKIPYVYNNMVELRLLWSYIPIRAWRTNRPLKINTNELNKPRRVMVRLKSVTILTILTFRV